VDDPLYIVTDPKFYHYDLQRNPRSCFSVCEMQSGQKRRWIERRRLIAALDNEKDGEERGDMPLWRASDAVQGSNGELESLYGNRPFSV
jgi:hypothetical protein